MTEITTLMMVTYNRLSLTKQTIGGLLEKTKRPFNLVIVDNNSQDGTKEYLPTVSKDNREYLKAIHIIFNDKNEGIALARNQALKQAVNMGSKWFCTIDNDIEVPEGWLNNCIEILKANKAYGAIGVNMEGVQYPIVTKNGCTFQDKPKGNLGTACMVFPQTTHKMLGFFKEYNKYGLEDSDFGMRVRCAGLKLGYILSPGLHCGDDSGEQNEYRKFKTNQHDSKLKEFNRNCALYVQGKLPIYIPFVGKK